MQMYQSGSEPALAAHMLQSGNINNQQCAGVNNPLVSHMHQLVGDNPLVRQLGNSGDDSLVSHVRQLGTSAPAINP